MNAYLEDHALMQRIARGDAGAFRELSNEHLTKIVTYSTRLLGNQAEAEEIAQETFLRAWEKAGKYEPKAKVTTWLHTIARRLCIDKLRSRGARGDHLSIDDERDEAPMSGRPSQLLVRKQKALGVRAALEMLPERQREALVLSHEQGLSNPEIAEVLESSIEAVESLLSRGRRGLRNLIQPSILPTPSQS